MTIKTFFEMNDFYDGDGITMIVKDTNDDTIFEGTYLDMMDEVGDKEITHFSQEVDN